MMGWGYGNKAAQGTQLLRPRSQVFVLVPLEMLGNCAPFLQTLAQAPPDLFMFGLQMFIAAWNLAAPQNLVCLKLKCCCL